MGNFNSLGLKKEILDVLSGLNFKNTLDVQEQVIPAALKGKNIVFTSRTGSGKTLAYLLGFLGKINRKAGIQMVVLVPTRELCIQVGKEIKRVCNPLGINVGMLYGGRTLSGDQKTTTKKNQIMVGTPGRLIQHVNEKNIRVGDVKYLVYDESDQMFDHGFYDDCSYIKERVSRDAQILLSSATITDKVDSFIENVIRDYEFLKVGELIPKNIVQEKIYCEKSEKKELLLNLLSQKKFRHAIVFCNTKIKTADVEEFLTERRFNAKTLNSDLEQKDRLNTLNLFKEGKIRILVTTDIAARGLHIENVDVIVNYDAPTRAEFYIHRIGRTGRGNAHGYALSLICPEDVDRFYNIEFDYNLKVKQVNHITAN